MEEKDERGFTIRDKRTASSEGPQDAKTGDAGPKDESTGRRPDEAPKPEEPKDAGPSPEMDFLSFIISLATTAQVSLGLMPNPQTSLTAKNLPAAKQMIDIIVMLKDKTKGNLNDEEQSLIDNLLYSLRIQYINIAGDKK